MNYNADIETVSKLIDSLCDMSKIINPPKGAGETGDSIWSC